MRNNNKTERKRKQKRERESRRERMQKTEKYYLGMGCRAPPTPAARRDHRQRYSRNFLSLSLSLPIFLSCPIVSWFSPPLSTNSNQKRQRILNVHQAASCSKTLSECLSGGARWAGSVTSTLNPYLFSCALSLSLKLCHLSPHSDL